MLVEISPTDLEKVAISPANILKIICFTQTFPHNAGGRNYDTLKVVKKLGSNFHSPTPVSLQPGQTKILLDS